MQQRYSGLLLGIFIAIASPLKISNNSINSSLQPKQITETIRIADNPENSETASPQGLFQQLNLTPQQKSKIRQIRRRYQSPILQLKHSLNLAQQQLASMMAGTESAELVRAKHEEIARFRQQLGELHFKSMLATREILTPQQRQKFAEIIQAKPKSSLTIKSDL